MTWSYLDPTAAQQWAWCDAYRCPFCGSGPSREDSANGRCYCRRCESCTMDWKADVVAGMDEGRPHRELCPDCREEPVPDPHRTNPLTKEMTMTTIKSLTESQIRKLRAEADAAGDDAMVAICIVAQDGEFHSYDWTTLRLDPSTVRRIEAMDRDAAYVDIVRAINATEAQSE